MHREISIANHTSLRPKMKNDRLIPTLLLRVYIYIYACYTYGYGETERKALSTIGSWSSSRDGLMLDRSLPCWRAVVPKKGISLDKLYRVYRQVDTRAS